MATDDFEGFLSGVRRDVNERLETFLSEHVARVAAEGRAVSAMATAVRDLTVRGGKRQRAGLVAAGYLGCGGEGGVAAVAMAGVAMELLQTYLLIHDDWMDQDDVRRGGPSVHARLAEELGDRHLGASLAILAGDWASVLAYRALSAVPVPTACLHRAIDAMNAALDDVIIGQALDVVAHDALERIHLLKTASYTVRLPLTMGAALAGAPESIELDLARFAEPLGVAFQLRDDLLGGFGDPRVTGKPTGNDIRRGKNTALAAELRRDPAAKKLFDGPLDEAGIERIRQAMIETGAKERVEVRLRQLLDEARAQLERLAITPEIKLVLGGAVDALGERIQ